MSAPTLNIAICMLVWIPIIHGWIPVASMPGLVVRARLVSLGIPQSLLQGGSGSWPAARRSRTISTTLLCNKQHLEIGEKMARGRGGFPSCPRKWDTHVEVKGGGGGGLGQTTLLLTDKRARMREIFDAELEIVAGATEVAWGLWQLDSPLPHDDVCRLASARAQLRVLAGPCDSHALLASVVGRLGITLGSQSTFTIHHERLERGPGEEARPVELACALARLLQGGVPSLQKEDLDVRLAVIECESGFWFCACDWSAAEHAFPDWRSGGKPFTFNAALDPDVATAACNMALATAQQITGLVGADMTLWDITCGSGTQLFAGLRAGFGRCVGFDANPACMQGAAANLEYFGVPIVRGDEGEDARGHVMLCERDSRQAPPAGAWKGDAVVTNLPFGRNYITQGGGDDVREMLARARGDCPRGPVCCVSGEEVGGVLGECGYKVIKTAGSWNGKRYTFFMTLAVPAGS